MKHILLPTDFSQNSWNAIKYAIELFKDEACTFYLLNTYTPVIYHVEYVLGYPAQFGLGDAIRNTAQENLKTMVTKISNTFEENPKHKFQTMARFDTFISGLKDFLETHTIDMIVMGTKGATGAQEILFGSNTVHAINGLKCPILAIPAKFTYESPHEILFPTDLELAYNNSQLRILKDIADSHHSRVNAMHISEGYDLTEDQKKNKTDLELMFKNTAYLFHNIKSRNISEAINDFQIKHKINLLAMINNKHNFFENLFFKNTINQIGFHLKVPFLVIPADYK